MPASNSRSRVASGSAVLPGHERGLAARRDGPAGARPGARPAARRAESPRSWTSGQPCAGQDLVCRDRRGRRLGRHAGRVVAAGVGPRHAVEPVAGVLEVQVGGADGRQRARATPGRPTASRCRSARTATSGPSRRRRRIRASPTSNADRADALGAVEQDGHVDLGERRSGRTAPVTQLTCEQATSLVCGPTASASSRERHGAHGHAAARAQRRQRSEQAGVLVRRGEDLVAATRAPGRPGRAPTPSLVHVVSATSAASAPSERGVRVALTRRAARSAPRRRPSRGPSARAAVEHLAGSRGRPRAAAARRCRRSGRPGPRGPGTRRAGRRRPCAAGYVTYRPQTGQGDAPARA